MKQLWFLCSILFLVADAHVRLEFPVPRSHASGLKEPSPCGGIGSQGFRTIVLRNTRATVFFTETVYHPGYFEVSWSDGGETVTDFNVVSGAIYQHNDLNNYIVDRSWNYTYPDISCPASFCKLRVRQFMQDSASNYYTCADIQLVDQSTYSSMMSSCASPCTNPVFINGTCVCDYWSNPSSGGATTTRATTRSTEASANTLSGNMDMLLVVLMMLVLLVVQ